MLNQCRAERRAFEADREKQHLCSIPTDELRRQEQQQLHDCRQYHLASSSCKSGLPGLGFSLSSHDPARQQQHFPEIRMVSGSILVNGMARLIFCIMAGYRDPLVIISQVS